MDWKFRLGNVEPVAIKECTKAFQEMSVEGEIAQDGIYVGDSLMRHHLIECLQLRVELQSLTPYNIRDRAGAWK